MSQAGYTSGGEQQMTAIGRAPTGKPKLILLDEPSMGLAPQLVEEIFEIVSKLNTQERVSFLLAEQNRMVALRFPDYGYVLQNGRVVLDGAARPRGKRRREGVLSRALDCRPQELPKCEALSPSQALALLMGFT